MMKMNSTLLLCLFGWMTHEASAKLVFTEIMIDPLLAQDTSTQWFELYNTADTAVELKGYKLSFCSYSLCSYYTVSATKSIDPYGYVVFGNNGNPLTNGNVKVDIQMDLYKVSKDGSNNNLLYIVPPKSNTSDDSLQFNTKPAIPNEKPFYIKLPFVPGASLAKINAGASGQYASNWKPSMSLINCVNNDKGTPGKINSYTCPPPTKVPTKSPTKSLTKSPTKPPTKKPTASPTKVPTKAPTKAPTKVPTSLPTKEPTKALTKKPSSAPTEASLVPVAAPSKAPTKKPTTAPTKASTGNKKCGLLGLSMLCLNGCGMFGRAFSFCKN